jgi:hypothetical protein
MPPSPFRRIGRHGSKSVMPNGMLKKDAIIPTRPQARQDAPLPELHSRFEKFSMYPWARAGLGRLRVGWVKYWYASDFFHLRPCPGEGRVLARLGRAGAIETF